MRWIRRAAFSVLVPALAGVCLTDMSAAQSVYRAFLDQAQITGSPPVEVHQPGSSTASPPIPYPAEGTFFFDPTTNRLLSRVELSRAPTVASPLARRILAVDVHHAPVGHDGPVLFSLARKDEDFVGSRVLSPAEASWLMANELYVVVKTRWARDGEIRGQIATGDRAFLAVMRGCEVVPPVQTSNEGLLSVVLSPTGDALTTVNTMFFMGMPIDALDMHDGQPGTNGPIARELNWYCPLTCYETGVSALEVAKLRAGRFYADVHTPQHPSGELRGRLVSIYLPYAPPCPGTHAPAAPALSFGDFGISVDTPVPFEVGLVFIGTVGADIPVPGAACRLGVSLTAPHAVIPVAMDASGAAYVGNSIMPSDTWLYAQYFGNDPGAPGGLHASQSVGRYRPVQ